MNKFKLKFLLLFLIFIVSSCSDGRMADVFNGLITGDLYSPMTISRIILYSDINQTNSSYNNNSRIDPGDTIQFLVYMAPTVTPDFTSISILARLFSTSSNIAIARYGDYASGYLNYTYYNGGSLRLNAFDESKWLIRTTFYTYEFKVSEYAQMGTVLPFTMTISLATEKGKCNFSQNFNFTVGRGL